MRAVLVMAPLRNDADGAISTAAQMMNNPVRILKLLQGMRRLPFFPFPQRLERCCCNFKTYLESTQSVTSIEKNTPTETVSSMNSSKPSYFAAKFWLTFQEVRTFEPLRTPQLSSLGIRIKQLP